MEILFPQQKDREFRVIIVN